MEEDPHLEEKQIEEAKKNPQSFEPLYKKYYERILRFVYKRMENLDDTREITSSVFIKALSNISKYTYRGHPFSSWLYRIALNEITQFYRDANKMRVISIDTYGISRVADETGKDRDLNPVLAKAMQHLSEEEVLLLELRFFEDKAFAEVGAILDITENNAKVKTYRVIDKLREIFKKLND
ncbi:MAG TPA: sigma-70 family RNA polymerase sigma factor [Bacteroidia bacterium]|jgi:RNA polymerase sigma-70 factor (ECF subfamily)|nr:sigma-70 family RNA polymerase sigma factor [Bacteroidia bacterium]